MLSRRTFLSSAIALAIAPVLRKLHPVVKLAQDSAASPMCSHKSWSSYWTKDRVQEFVDRTTPIENIQAVQKPHGAQGTLTWNGKTFKVHDWSIERMW
jgi:hypothetical protein